MSAEYRAEVVIDLHQMVRQGLHRWAFSAQTEVTLLNLSENATFLARDPATENQLVLRVHRLHYSSVPEIYSELAWIGALRKECIVATAAPVAGINGRLVQTLPSMGGYPGREVVAFEFLPGNEPDRTTDLAHRFWQLGEINARLHGHARGWQKPTGFVRKRWDFDAMVGPQAYWGSWRVGLGLESSGVSLIEQVLALIGEKLHTFGMSPERFGLVHADLRLANLLVDGDTLRVIDFDDCGFSWFMYDFAAAVSFIEHEPTMPTLMAAWINGYRNVAPLDDEEVAMIPLFVMLRRILLTAWVASHAEVPFARELGNEYTAGTLRLAAELLTKRL